MDTGFQLAYVFLHGWTGQVMRTVVAGPAPPLDAAGNLVMPAATAQGSASMTAADDPSGNIAAGKALLASVGAAVGHCSVS